MIDSFLTVLFSSIMLYSYTFYFWQTCWRVSRSPLILALISLKFLVCVIKISLSSSSALTYYLILPWSADITFKSRFRSIVASYGLWPLESSCKLISVPYSSFSILMDCALSASGIRSCYCFLRSINSFFIICTTIFCSSSCFIYTLFIRSAIYNLLEPILADIACRLPTFTGWSLRPVSS